MELHADGFESFAQSGDDFRKPIAADVWTGVHQDLRRGPVKREDLEHIAHRAPLVRPCVELSVTIGPGPAFAETVVAIGIDQPLAIEERDVAAPGLHPFSAFDDPARNSVTRQLVCAEQARRT